jgi:N-acetyl-gamma-glutamyl-phosphate reductase
MYIYTNDIFVNISMAMIKAAIVGASGYSGAELVRLLAGRDDVALVRLTGYSTTGKTLDEIYPVFSGKTELPLDAFNAVDFKGIDVAFIALPSGQAMQVVPQLSPVVGKIIDLGGDFRLPSVELYQRYYKHEHTAPHLLNASVYGLPELNKSEIAHSCFIANPGCYPTSAILPLLPALKNDMISSEGIVINSLSGVSGAGRSASTDLSFTEVNENIRAYKIGSHQHIPEIETVLSRASGKEVTVSFIPHLVPVTRGIYTTIHASLKKSVSESDLAALYKSFYADAPFVRMRSQIPQIKDVAYTNYCDIAVKIEPRTNQLILLSVIDNLVKGAAGQAIQNMNIMFGLPETTGLN